MRAMVSPEQACAYYSMQAAEQRLKVRHPCINLQQHNESYSLDIGQVCSLLCDVVELAYCACCSQFDAIIFYIFHFYFNYNIVCLLICVIVQDAGYGEKSLFSCDDDNDDNDQKIDDEVCTQFSQNHCDSQ